MRWSGFEEVSVLAAIMDDTTYNAWFRCFRGCEGRYALTDVIYACPTCGGLLEVTHDMEVLKLSLIHI